MTAIADLIGNHPFAFAGLVVSFVAFCAVASWVVWLGERSEGD